MMKRKLLAIACAGMLTFGCMGLAACGDTSSGSGSGSESASAAVDPAQDFEGSWELAAAEGNGVTFAGEFEAMFGTAGPVTLDLAEDGTGTLSLVASAAASDGTGESSSATAESESSSAAAEDSGTDSSSSAAAVEEGSLSFTWELKDDGDGIAITADADALGALNLVGGESSEDGGTVTVTGTPDDDGSLSVELGDGTYATRMVFTRDGEMADLPEMSVEHSKKVSSAEDLKGTWALTGVNVNDMLFYGDSTDLAALMSADDVLMEFKDDGVVTVMDQDMEYAVDDDGATITMNDTEFPITMLDGDILLEYPEDDTGIAMVYRYTKEQ